jgi:hypothetical protein
MFSADWQAKALRCMQAARAVDRSSRVTSAHRNTIAPGSGVLSQFACPLLRVASLECISGPADPDAEHASILTTMSLLSAGAIADNFTFTHQDAHEDEKWLVTVLSFVFALLFHVLFGAVSFHAGRARMSQTPPAQPCWSQSSCA